MPPFGYAVFHIIETRLFVIVYYKRMLSRSKRITGCLAAIFDKISFWFIIKGR